VDLLSGLMGAGVNLGGILGGRKSATAGRNVFKKILAHGDWWDTDLETSSGVILLRAGIWQTIGRYTVPAQQMLRFGYGSALYPDNQGHLHIAVYDDTATNSVVEEGSIRLVQRNAQGTVLLVIAEFRTENLRGSTTDRQMMVPLPEQTQFPVVGEDSVLEIQFKPDAADSIVSAAIGTAAGLDIWNVPVTVYQ